MSLPNFLVIGAPRAGTSLLHHKILLPHPEVYVPVQRKEVHYFDRYYERGLEWYQSYFPSGEAEQFQAIGEVTPDYLATPEAPARIHALLPGCRLVAILRNPVDRAWSWYLHARRSRNEGRDFARFIEEDPAALSGGLYHQHLQRYLALFPRQQLLVLIYEELVENPGRELGRLAAFLGVGMIWSDPAALLHERVNPGETPRFAGTFALARRAAGALTRHDLNWPVRVAKQLGVRRWFGRTASEPTLSAAERRRLADFYRDDVGELAALLERDLEVWPL